MNRLPRISLRPALLPALLALLALPAPASASTLDWTTVVGPSIEDMAVDPGGNTYFVSNYETSNPYETGFHVIRLDPEGNIGFSRSFSFAVWTERAYAIALGPDGSIFVAGTRNDVPGNPESEFQQGFVVKLDPTASTVLYNRTLGGLYLTVAEDLAIDAEGRAYVILSSNYHETYGLRRVSADGSQILELGPDLGGVLTAIDVGPGGDVFVTGFAEESFNYAGGMVARLDPFGSLIYRTVLAVNDLYFPAAIAAGPEDSVYIAGSINPPDSPTDAFVVRIDAGGNLAGTKILGGSGPDVAWSVAVAPSGDVLVVGRSGSDASLARLDAALSTILESTDFGGSDDDVLLSVGTDAQGSVYLGGNSQSSDLPGGGGPGGFGARLVADGQAPDCSAAVAEPSVIAPANGELVPVSVSGVTGPGGAPADLVFTDIHQDEPIGGGGPDAIGVGTATASVRASRSGQGDGRVYHLEFRATDPEGFTCSGEVTVCVPLNQQSPGCGDGGAAVDSTVTRPRNASLLWSTFLGGSGDEVREAGVEIDASYHAWIAGTTASEDYPVLHGATPSSHEDEYFFLDGFVSRISQKGSLERSGYSGEDYSDDFVEGLAIGPNGESWFAGWYDSYDDTEVIVDRTPRGQPVGGSFTFFNGDGVDKAFAVATDLAGNAYVAGESGSRWFAGLGQPFEGGVGDYALKLGPDGQLLELFQLPGQPGAPAAIAVDAAGNLYLTGATSAAAPDVWVLKLDPAGALVWSATLAGSGGEASSAIAVDAAGRVWVAGWTDSPDFPLRGGRFPAGGRDAFLARLTSGGELDVSTLLGGAGTDEAQDLTLDAYGRPYLAGTTSSADFPLLGPLAGSCGAGRACGGESDAFAAAFDLYATSNLVLTFSTRFGGGGLDAGHGVAVTAAGTYLWLSGLTRSTDFQTFKPSQPALAGEADAFVARIILAGS